MNEHLFHVVVKHKNLNQLSEEKLDWFYICRSGTVPDKNICRVIVESFFVPDSSLTRSSPSPFAHFPTRQTTVLI